MKWFSCNISNLIRFSCFARYMNSYDKPFPAVAYFDPQLCDVLCFASWKLGDLYDIFLRQIQKSIYQEITKWRSSIFMKIQPAFQKRMQSR